MQLRLCRTGHQGENFQTVEKSYQLRCIFDPTELIFATLFRSVAGSRGRTGATHDSQSLDRTRHLSDRSIFRGRSGVGARHVYVIPFRVTSIHSDQEGFLFDVPEKAAKLHLIPIAFVGDDDTRKVSTKIEVETDRAGGTTVQCEAFAAVIASEPGVEAQVQR